MGTIYTLLNDDLSVQIDAMGAEPVSVKDRRKNGKELLWNGDPRFWDRHSPILFPFCGRVYNGKATADGIPCDIPLHGFFHSRVAEGSAQKDGSLVFTETDDAQTLARYPYPFRVDVRYRLNGRTLTVETAVTNTGDKPMHYGFGAHPGFALDGPTEEYRVRFGRRQAVRQVRFDADACYPVGGSDPFPLADGDTFSLSEAQFRVGSFFLCDMPDSVTLLRGDDPVVTLSYPAFSYLGFWKVPEAKFLCIEPWCSLPAHKGETVEFSARPDFLHLAAGETKTHTYTITFH